MMRTTAVLFLLLLTTASAQQAQQPSPVEQRLGATIGALIVENSRLVIELDAAKRLIEQLQKAAAEAKAREN